MYYTTNSDKPCAYITNSKQRLKQFGQNVYLKNGSEFELELYNPTTKTVLAKIKLNGSFIPGGGIIVKPGQRIYLERYLDEAKKFKFETYEVDAFNKEVANAISNNGEVIVYFYDEYIQTYDYTWFNNKRYYRSNFNDYPLTNSIGTPLSNYYSNISLNNSVTMDSLNSFSSQSYTNDQAPKLKTLNVLRKSTLETGTVEKGGSSNQEFTYSNKQFCDSTTNASIWKILPESQKPYQAEDLKVFCTECGTKRKKDSFKFCPNCGTKY